jgi:AcrR family transcriptional regulator
LLTAAREIFAERGYKGTSTRDIAERAGVTEVMIFRHFGTKASLFQEAVVAPFTSFIQEYLVDYRGREHGVRSPYEEGLDLYTGFFEVLHGEREVLLALMSARQFDDLPVEASAQVDAAFADVLSVIEEVVGNESVERGFSGFDLGPTVRVMFAMVLSVALHGDWMGLHKDAAYRQVIEAMTTLTVRGLQVPEG